MRHKPELDGIRGIAILGVLLTHCFGLLSYSPATKPLLVLMSFGNWGVDLFFALSGFLITGILLETKRAANYFRSFYPRRFLRIFPIYYLALAILFSWALISPWAAANMPFKREWPSYLVYLQNLPWCWPYGFVTGHMVGHFWSLAVEEQFYFIWPLVILFIPETAVLWICGVGCALALPLRIYLVQHVFGSSWAQMIVTTSRMDGLLIGAALAIVLRRREVIPARVIALGAAVGVSIISWIAIFHPTHEFVGSGPYMRTFGVTAMALLSGTLIAVSQRRIPFIHRLLTMRWLRFYGRYSYGLYVYHVPIYVIAERLVAPKLGIHIPMALGAGFVAYVLVINAVSLAVAVFSFEYFEARFLRLKHRFAPRVARRAGEEVTVAS